MRASVQFKAFTIKKRSQEFRLLLTPDEMELIHDALCLAQMEREHYIALGDLLQEFKNLRNYTGYLPTFEYQEKLEDAR